MQFKLIKTALGIHIPGWRTSLAFFYDVSAALLAWALAYLLRFNFAVPAEFVLSLWHVVLWAVPFQAIIFISAGLYRGVWRFASIPDLQRILRAVFIAAFAIAGLLFMFKPGIAVPSWF